MLVRIGMTNSNKELEVELAEGMAGDTVVADITNAVSQDAGMVWLTDRKGRRVGVATSKLAYVEVASEADSRRVGFSAL